MDFRGRLVTLLAVAGQDHTTSNNSALTLWLYDAEQDDFLLIKASMALPPCWTNGDTRLLVDISATEKYHFFY